VLSFLTGGFRFVTGRWNRPFPPVNLFSFYNQYRWVKESLDFFRENDGQVMATLIRLKKNE
jgi:hypothetical protein